MQRVACALLLVVGVAWSAEIDNHLVGEPVVDCQDTMVGSTVSTMNECGRCL